MKHLKTTVLLFLGVSLAVTAQDTSKPVPVQPAKSVPAPIDPKSPEAKALAKLATENSMFAEQVKKDLADLRARVQRLKLEKEALSEELTISKLQIDKGNQDAYIKHAQALKELTRSSELAKAEAAQATDKLKTMKALWGIKTAHLQAEIDEYEIKKKRDTYADATPIYLENPLKDDDSLVISDRRIPLNGIITYATADYITSRINYFNNKDGKKPIFIVIDGSPGGSVMSGYRILKAMEGSSAPVYVVVKSYAASMAAAICTLAEQSYAYPNAILIHHQISSFAYGNLTEQREHLKEIEEWWRRLAGPLAKKMGITPDEFIEKMYKKVSTGDWWEFASDAQKIKWVDHIVNFMHETSLLQNPDSSSASKPPKKALVETTGEDGKPCIYLPRLHPKDCYFLYNKDGYYRVK